MAQYHDRIIGNFSIPNIKDVYSLCKCRDNIAKTLLDSGVGSDVTFIFVEEGCEIGKIKAHRILLSLRSPVFATMFGIEMKESIEGVVEIEDMSEKSMRILFAFIYSVEVDSEWGSVAAELIYGADKYDLPELKAFLCENIESVLSVRNVMEIRELAKLQNLPEVVEYTLTFIKENIKEFLDNHVIILKQN